MTERTPEQERARYGDLSVPEIAARLGVCAKTVRRYIAATEDPDPRVRAGGLVAVNVGAGRNKVYRVERRELERFITRRTVGGGSAQAA